MVDTEPFTVNAKFRGFAKYPMADMENPELWKQTRDFDVPWGEIVIGPLIFTVPTSVMREIGDFSAIYHIYGFLITELSNFIGPVVDHSYRIVFDVDLPGDQPVFGYPLLFRIEAIDGILIHLNSVSDDLFSVFSLIAVLTLRDCFDLATETALGALAASVICKKLFPSFDPLALAGLSLPVLFNELWEIHTTLDPTVISRTLATFQDPDYEVADVPEDMWIAFVKVLSRNGKRNFTKLLERAKPIPLNVATSLQDLPVYDPAMD
jgi:hypothetical protein